MNLGKIYWAIQRELLGKEVFTKNDRLIPISLSYDGRILTVTAEEPVDADKVKAICKREMPEAEDVVVTASTPVTEVFTGDGVTREFRLSRPASTINQVAVNELIYYAGTDYREKADRQTVVFNLPPESGAKIKITYTPS